MTVFDQVLDVVLGWEGGFSAIRSDPGNWTGGQVGAGELRGTNFGISAASYPDLDIASLTRDLAKAIYRRDYWDPIAGDRLAGPLALMAFDAAVNNGVRRASVWLQQAVGAAPDGRIGPATIAAVLHASADKGAERVCADYLALRIDFMAGLGAWKTFGAGWSRRLARLPYQSVLITSEAARES